MASVFEAPQAADVQPLAVAAQPHPSVRMVAVELVRAELPGDLPPWKAQYEEMWAQDVAAMVGYHGQASAAAAQLTSWQSVAAHLRPGRQRGRGEPRRSTWASATRAL